MNEEFEQQLVELSTYLNLIVKFSGGEIDIPYEFIEQGLNPMEGVKVVTDSDARVVKFVIAGLEEVDAEQ